MSLSTVDYVLFALTFAMEIGKNTLVVLLRLKAWVKFQM